MCGTAARIRAPTGPEPVNDTTGSRGSATSSAACSLLIGSTENIPGGRSSPAMISPSSSAVSGVAGAGLRMIGAPTARAGATLWATRLSGKLNGAMPSTGPRGTRRTSAIRPAAAGSVSRRCSSPENRRASSAAQRKVETARATSARAHLSGLPFSAVISSANSSARPAIPALIRSRAVARAKADSSAAGPVAATAAATASSICSGVARPVRPTTCVVNGSRMVSATDPVVARPAT